VRRSIQQIAALNRVLGSNYRHPEQRRGEVFLLNIHESETLGWASGRRGEKAYATQSQSVVLGPQYRPAFALESEILSLLEACRSQGK